ncbi:MAG: divalent-cation tolerance protein CutA, partial [Deltaproteobacteria bacterium]|nr:divalent-cation tolerance protein CutA [Deltaproteobacteria bacterium]
MEGFIQVTTTTEKRADADRIALALVEQRLAACVQIVGPVTSVYRWKGKIETTREWLCLIKSRAESYGAVEQAIRSL